MTKCATSAVSARGGGACIRLAAALAVVLCTAGAAFGADETIRNPYYRTPEWKLWHHDPAPVVSDKLIAPGQMGQLAPPPESARVWPDDPDPKAPLGTFLAFRKTDWPERKYAGFWDDVYLSLDANDPRAKPPTPHSWMPGVAAWTGKFGNAVPPLSRAFMSIYGPRSVGEFGVNFTSQSTTGMGNDIADCAPRLARIEQGMYFANCLRAGPAANGAYGESDYYRMEDRYQALAPCYYNSCGQSNSETKALVKMMIAGAYLPKEMKPELKRNGLYIATLLYIWKAALPVDAPYDSELRHRVAYCSSGDSLGAHYLVNRAFHLYDDTAHLANMVAMAKSMTVAPPVPLLKKVELTGGTEIYFLKTAALIHQKKGETAMLRVSTADSFDLAGRPLMFRWKVLYGNPRTTVEREGASDIYRITVPPDEKLPKGRTSILLIANNGVHDSNPACVNIYRPDGAANRRPTIEGPSDRVIFPGERVTFDVKAEDPDGFPVTLHRRSGEVGTLAGNTFTWDCPATTPEGVYPVTILASDGTTGTNSRQVFITVTSTRAKVSADKASGPSPLTVKFSGAASADWQKNALAFQWDFGDGATSTDAEPTHTFTQPGFYRVKLTATGPLGSHSDQMIVAANHGWPLRLDNGWSDKNLDPAVWKTKDLPAGFASIRGGTLRIARPKNDTSNLETVETFRPPLYLEAEFKKSWGTKGDGFDVLGCFLGWDYSAGMSPFLIRNAAGNQKQDIGQYLGESTLEKATLRLYVVSDPLHPGKSRYTGYLDGLLGPFFFSFDDQPVTPATLKAICTFAYMELSRFQVWAPAGPAP